MAGLIDRRAVLRAGLGGSAILVAPALAWGADAASEPAIDAIVEAFMQRFDVPGAAVSIVRPGTPPYLKGYGVRTQGRPGAVDVHTRFDIASNSKAFTAAAIAILVDEGKLGWDDPVTKFIPEFRMADAHATAMMTVRDLLVHRSGLALGAGDLMQFPATNRPPADVLRALPHLPLERGFRTGYAYDNILYVVAGILIERVAGRSWADFVTERLLRPAGMSDARATLRQTDGTNVAGRHARLGPPVRGMGAMRIVSPDEGLMIDAAGGIQASVSDIAKWHAIQLAKGVTPGGQRLWSEKQAAEMWLPQVITRAGPGPAANSPTRPVMQGYALGWFVQERRGERFISHSGGLSGQVTYTGLLPERGIAVAVFTNVEEATASWIQQAILDHLVGAPPFDWLGEAARRAEASDRDVIAALGAQGDRAPAGAPSLPLASYAGRYRDPWYGDIVVSVRRGKLHIDFTPTPVFKSMLEPWGTDAFRTRFPPNSGEDAVVTFAVADGRVTGVTMKPLSPLADFSYDFHHLAFVPVR